MKTLSYSCILFATTAATLLAQDSTVTNATAQADRRFLRDLEQSDPRAPTPVAAGDAPAAPVADIPATQRRNTPAPSEPTVVAKPAARRSVVAQNRVNEAMPTRRNEDAAAPTATREKAQTDQKSVARRQKKEAEVRTAETSRAEQPDEVAAKPAKTVTATKTANVVPEEADRTERHDEHGFLHRLFHHERPRKEAPVTTTVEESTQQPVIIDKR
jgi:hypothetical protein